MAYDEMELDLLGDRRTALFVIISDTDDTFNFVVSIRRPANPCKAAEYLAVPAVVCDEQQRGRGAAVLRQYDYRADNVGVAVLVLPAVLNGKAHTIQQHSIQQLGIPGHLLEQISLDQCFRHTVKAVSVCFQTFKIVTLPNASLREQTNSIFPICSRWHGQSLMCRNMDTILTKNSPIPLTPFNPKWRKPEVMPNSPKPN